MEATKNVLVCEDDPVQLRILSAMITQAGYRSLSARTPEEAVTAARRCGIDAVVTDVQLQDGNGFDLLGDLRQHGFDAPVFMASAYATDGIRERARAAGVRDFFVKPFNYTAIKSRVGEAIQASKRLDATVLILEGHSEARAGLKRSVSRAGFRVIAVSDGAEVLKVLRSRGEWIDLLLMDLHAGGPSGGDLVRKALEIVPALYVVGISGDAQRQDIRAAYEAGAASFLRKPISEERLGQFLKASLRPAREARKREEEQQERARRLEAEPFLRKCGRQIRSILQAPGSSRRTAVVGGVALAALALSIGAIFGMAFQTMSNSVSETEQLMLRMLQSTGLPRSGAAFRPEEGGARLMDEQIRLMRESNDFTRRYYQDYLQEYRLQGRPQPATAPAPRSGSLPTTTRGDAATLNLGAVLY